MTIENNTSPILIRETTDTVMKSQRKTSEKKRRRITEKYRKIRLERGKVRIVASGNLIPESSPESRLLGLSGLSGLSGDLGIESGGSVNSQSDAIPAISTILVIGSRQKGEGKRKAKSGRMSRLRL